MLYIFRLIITVIYSILVCVLGSVYYLSSPRNPKHVATFGHMFGHPAPLFGLEVECRKPADAENYGNAICIVNHQNNYDMVTTPNTVQPPTVTIGKESLPQIPFFGQLYWLTGNLLIDGNNHTKAHSTIAEVVNHFKKHRISIRMSPGGTCSRSRGLLPFKTGAFHTAIAAGVSVIPACASATSDKINLNRLYNDLVIVEMLPPIDVSQYGEDQARKLVAHCRSIMGQEVAGLDKEAAERKVAGKV